MVFALFAVSFLAAFFSLTTFISYLEIKELQAHQSSKVKELENLKSEIHKLKTEIKPTPSIEAEQILNDMTRHGHSIVRIIPISPTDVFWRSPS